MKKEQGELLNKKIEVYKNHNIYFKNKNPVITNCQRLDFKGNMVEDLLMKVDKNTMAFAIEGRVPFLDHRIVELAWKIPNNLKLKGITKDKDILRKSVKNIIPAGASEYETGLSKTFSFFQTFSF